MKKAIALIFASTLMALAGTNVASAVVTQSRTLPDGNTLYAIECDSTGQLATIDELTAVATPVGTGEDHNLRTDIHCAGQAAWDIGTNYAYWPSWPTWDGSSPALLEKIDITTGESTLIGAFTGSGAASSGDVVALAMGPSKVLYALYRDRTNGRTRLASVDTATGNLTDISEIVTPGLTARNIWSFAYNPADQKFYATDATLQHLWEIDVTDGTVVDLGQQYNNYYIYGIGFDQSGVMYTSGADVNVETYTVTDWLTADVQATTQSMSMGNSEFYSRSVFVTYPVPEPPALAVTGGDFGQLATTSLAIGVVGFLLLVAARRKKANS